MRSAALGAMLLLAGCDMETKVDQRPAPAAEASENLLETVISSSGETGAAIAPSEAVAQNLQALGTEPFWSVEVKPGALLYTTPENPNGARIAYTSEKVGADTRFYGELDGEKVILLIVPGNCSDGMSDTVYPYHATWSIGSEIRGGCARPR